MVIADENNGYNFQPEILEILNGIQGNIYNDRFDNAEILTDSLFTIDSTGPLLYLFRAVLFQARMMAAESDFLKNQFMQALDSTAQISRTLLKNGEDSLLAYYCLGNAHAFRSLYEGRGGHMWNALRQGLAARGFYSKGYQLDTTFHDIAVGLGSYRYWKSVKTDAINWTPLFKDEKDNGIRLLERAADSSIFSRDAAKTALIWVYINEKMYGQALRLIDQMQRRYPFGLTFLWARGELYFKLGNYSQAIEVYRKIMGRLEDVPGNYYNLVEAAWFLDRCYRRTERKWQNHDTTRRDLAKKIESLPLPETTRKRQEDKLKSILEISR